jgi:hypothetical protein
MDFDVLPGPPLPELARTAMARADVATVSHAGSPRAPLGTVPVRADAAGRPVLLPDVGSRLARHLAADPVAVIVAIPADAPFSALRLTGMTRPAAGEAAGYPVTLRSLEFSGALPARIALDDYEAAAPDPFWREAPGILHHLEHYHMGELVSCVRAHGMSAAECAVPRSLDRFGLHLLVLTVGGLAAVRLAFPGGPVTSLEEVPASILAVLTCRCANRIRPR